MELDGTGIEVTVICPGVINTPIVRNRAAVSPVIPSAQLDRLESFYKKTGAHPSEVGERIVRAVQRGEDIVLVGPTASAMFHLKRLSRRLMRTATIMGCKRNGYLWPYTLPASNAVPVSDSLKQQA
jgi:short-subunit dehydrogenase